MPGGSPLRGQTTRKVTVLRALALRLPAEIRVSEARVAGVGSHRRCPHDQRGELRGGVSRASGDFLQFLWLNIVGVMKSEMMKSAEAWMLACGEGKRPDPLKEKNRRICKIDRCLIACGTDFSELVKAKWDRMSFFTQCIKCGEKMKYMRRLVDIRLDPFFLPSQPETRVDPCEMGLMLRGHPLCNIHGQYKLRRSSRTAPAGVHRTKLLNP